MNDQKWEERYFPGSPVVKNPRSNAEDASVIPGRGTKILHATGQVSLCNTIESAHAPKRPNVAKKKRGKKKKKGRETGYFESNIKGLILQSPRTVILRLALEYNHPKN